MAGLLPADRKRLEAAAAKKLEIVQRLRPFIEEQEASGSVIIKRMLNQVDILYNKIFNDIIDKGDINKDDVVTIRVIFLQLQLIMKDRREYESAGGELGVERK